MTRCDFPEFPQIRGRTTVSQQWETMKRSPMKSATGRKQKTDLDLLQGFTPLVDKCGVVGLQSKMTGELP